MKLPIILSGPILRRVEPTQIYIWIALSKRYRLGAELYSVNRDDHAEEYSYSLISDRTETQTIRLGENLYISMIKIVPKLDNKFPTDRLLGYNLTFRRNNEILSLENFNLLNPNHNDSIVYGNLKYPSFFINTKKDSKILYGSCRKLHGKGKDALAAGDNTVRKTYSTIEERPSSLYLLGDQIYADAVADPIAPFLYKLGEHLVGKKENLSEVDNRLATEPFSSSIDQIQGREYIATKLCGFTSTKAQNHLLTIGEYAAMYLMSWSPELWNLVVEEKQIEPFENAIEQNRIYFISPDYKEYEEQRRKEIEKHRERYIEQAEDLHRFQQTIPQVRRLLANIPTYMIFDDHDITDDWNINYEWKQKVENEPLGRHVIANGLTSYWAFQGWGNDPETFNTSFLKNMSRYTNSLRINSPEYQRWMETLFNFNSWHYVTPTHPKAVVLDTRTQRAYPTNPIPFKVGKTMMESTQGPELISEDGWKRISESLATSSWQRKEPLVIVSAAPLYGIGLIESFLINYLLPLKPLNLSIQTRFDLESWKFNGEGFDRFHKWIDDWDPGDCVIISGDAHMAFSSNANVEFHQKTERTLYQFTSSPLNNVTFSGFAGFALKKLLWLYGFVNKNQIIRRYCDSDYHLHEHNEPASYIWKEEIKYHSLDSGSIVNPDNNLGILSLGDQSIENEFTQSHL